jgi:hypothetical protein
MLSAASARDIASEIESLPEESVGLLRQFIGFLKYRSGELDDSAYLASVPGMMDSISEGVATPLSDCIPIANVWPDA